MKAWHWSWVPREYAKGILKCKFVTSKFSEVLRDLTNYLACTQVNIGSCDNVPNEVFNKVCHLERNSTKYKRDNWK